ncbi:MAG: flagellar biosynthesis protein FlhF [Deltaproteobacteria bacterium]|jgi:flagellar biosynthesis protein FlhF|nr:flagellar biosynthesis protein FlhF [Deltaproteobacteria bacterium]
MQVKSFTGTSTQEVLAQIRAEMGPDAVILSNRSFKKGGLRCHEVTAGIERVGAGRGVHESAHGMPSGWTEWHKDWMQIKSHLYALMKPSLNMEQLSPRQRVALEHLQREGVADEVLHELHRRLMAELGLSVLEPLEAMMPVRPWSRKAWEERVHILAGPFGGGKSTSALRMALLLHKEDPDLNIAFINADCVRGTGRLVLRHWAELSSFAYHEAPDAVGMRRAMNACAEADFIFVDMPGLERSVTLMQHLAALSLDSIGAATHLALPPHCTPLQTTAFLARYKGTTNSTLVWTKLDEAINYGAVLNVGHMSGIPVSALSYGPGLRDTLSAAAASQLWRLVFKRQLPGEKSLPPGTL